jgi:MarR family transcriptional regulator, transcriptional regulator for hemolysin
METPVPGPESPRRESFGLSLLQIGRLWRQAADAAIAGGVFPDAGWRPLLYLYRAGGEPLRQKDLAALIGMEGPSLVPLLDSLTAAGLVRRVEDPQDRRARRLSLTPAGEAIATRIQSRLVALEQDILSGLGEAELRTTAATLARMAEALARRRQG